MYYDNIMRFIFFVNTISLIQERKFVHCILLFQNCFEKFDILLDTMDKKLERD